MLSDYLGPLLLLGGEVPDMTSDERRRPKRWALLVKKGFRSYHEKKRTFEQHGEFAANKNFSQTTKGRQ